MSAHHLRAAALFGVVMLVVSGCATLPEGFDKPESFAYTDTDGTALGKAVQARRAEYRPGSTRSATASMPSSPGR